jgi:hypothetical protein
MHYNNSLSQVNSADRSTRQLISETILVVSWRPELQVQTIDTNLRGQRRGQRYLLDSCEGVVQYML